MINQSNAATVSRNMYSADINSDLINSYSWDTAVVYIYNFGTNNNYAIKTDKSGHIKKTGNSNDMQCKINDMGANVAEFTTESSTNSTDPCPCISRGASYPSTSVGIVSGRGRNSTGDKYSGSGFRPIIYF